MWLFVRERWTWIGFFLLLIGLANVLFMLDAGLASISVWYFNGLSVSCMIVFVSWRYSVEMRKLNEFIQHVDDLDRHYDMLSPFQQQYAEVWLNVLNDREQQVNKMTVRLQEEKDDLLSWVHEVKTPLTAMQLSIEQVTDSKLRMKLEKEWLRIFFLLDQQLHQTRLDSMEKDNRMERVQVSDIVFAELKAMRSWYLAKGIGVEYDDLDVTVYTDRKWFSFIVRQLLSNAVKYSHEQKEIRIYSSHHEQGYIQLHIQDEGIGIKAEDLPRIFHKSYTGNSGRESAGSSGMGLYLAHNAARKLGITITVQSKEQHGTCFTLTFPSPNTFTQIIGK